ncbi:hypothetical protein MHSWG343_05340 [Candidatus Mycoplasma haematohominis]|uniref:Uncharacterized protein n=1 Tax=Candidatus Mycoplasma haematohominis TaxID=1494318 RepID=A0A478FQX8_9MOLU|nr:hypothetical protein MHSWG343_05340 [Candidatus Mycoplasma haemohominis]
MDPIKGAASLGVLALLIGGGYALKGGLNLWTPEHSFLSGMDEFEKTYKDKTFGRIYGKYLSDPNKNEAWWSKHYEEVWKKDYEPTSGKAISDLSDEFKKTDKVAKAFGGTEDKTALNRVCEDAFKKESAIDIKPTSKDDTKDKYRKAIWKYCTIFSEELLTVKEGGDGSTNETIGKIKEEVLASTTSNKNDAFWALKQNEFFYGGESKLGTGHGSAEGKLFSDLYKQKGSKSQEQGALKSVCADAYKKKSTDISEQEVVKYCSLIEDTTASKA